MPNSEPNELQAHALRLSPGEDILPALMAKRAEFGWSAAFVVAGIGSLTRSTLRYADQSTPITLKGPLEIISLSGTLSIDGAHLHISVSDSTGRVIGGHLKAGSVVRTTAEILIALVPGAAFLRETDARTGFRELKVMPRGDV